MLPRVTRRDEERVTDVLFYHLQRQPLEEVLPTLVEKSLERGWRAVKAAGHEATYWQQDEAGRWVRKA